ncbi:probable glucan 1,3-beta-glucosidase [Serendipita indica DSM 11827]|uniref:Probable glucan 1,3-beta-glucosidase n=1 Tax=Serendipita indica (strain DSM 11827) TaxID=1109443 RepID=G4T8T3_SERID|nr:probable glucan 1,3-beta-glucosidase [Serendipita indica DSM 11827]
MRSFGSSLILLLALRISSSIATDTICPTSSSTSVSTVTSTITVTSTSISSVSTVSTSTSSSTTATSSASCSTPLGNGIAGASDPWWLQNMPHVGTSAFNPSPLSYKVFRNVKDYGAVGDGVTDDTAAINAAIADQSRCGQGCTSSTTTPALVYFPAGNYLVSAPIIPFYYTALVGDAKNRPTLIAAASFVGMAVIDADPYIPGGGGAQYWVNQNNFFRAVRNFNIDLTRMPVASTATGLHWQVSQATSLSFVKVIMSQDPATQHQGIFMENGSGGVLSDLEFVGGNLGVFVGNQQFTVRNVKFSNNKIAIQAIWNWGWTWQNVQIENCGIGIQMKTGGTSIETQTVGSEVLLDFTVTNTPIFVQTTTAQPSSLAGSIVIENAKLTNVPIAVGVQSGATVLAGSTGTMTIAAWAQGNIYSGAQPVPNYVQSNITPPAKPASLLDSSGKIFGVGRPQYENYAASQFVSVKAHGAKGDGVTDDTAALQSIFDTYAGCKIIFFDAGTYLVSDTINIPVGTDIVGEMWSQILAKGTNFNDQNNPRVVLKFGKSGDVGSLRVSDIVISTYAGSAGAIVMEVNIKQASQGSVGFWDTHVRLGGSAGTGLTQTTCLKLQGHGVECSAAFLSAHITRGASAYMENVWLWTADHQLDDDPAESQIDVFSGRGILIEGENVWLVGTGSEHHAIYQYRVNGATNVYMGLIQTETPYYQPNPAAPNPFVTNSAYSDPDVSSLKSALALSVTNSDHVLIYGAGLYSFFVSYAQTCLQTWNCQDQIASVGSSNQVRIYGLSTVATTWQMTFNGTPAINQNLNRNGFASTVTAWSSNELTRVTKRWVPVKARMHKRMVPARLPDSY